MKILVINPGGTSTKIAIFEDKTQIYSTSIVHNRSDLQAFSSVFDEFPYRLKLIEKAMLDAGYTFNELSVVVGRGGLMKPVQGGTYIVSDSMISDMKNTLYGEHPSNLGAALAKHIGDIFGIPSYIVDPVSVDELDDISRITGMSDLELPSWFHALNHKAVCRHVAEKMGGEYSDYNFIVAHLGSGISIVAHSKGKMIDGSGGRTNGTFSPERSGGLPAYSLIELCYSGKYTHEHMVQKVSTIGGMYDYLGTKDVSEVEHRAQSGDAKAKLILKAFWYQIARDIAMYGASLYGKVDRIILTGGIAHSKDLAIEIEKRVGYLAPIEVIPGEMEMFALALGALRVQNGTENALVY